MNHDSYDNAYIAGILNSVKTIAIVGASANDVRPSWFVLKYMLDKGFSVFPINPGHAGKEILGRMTYARLADIPQPIDMVDIFRAPAAVPGIVDEVLALDPLPKVLWMQLGVRHDEAASKAEAAGIKVVMNRCPKIEYGRLSGEIGWNGVNSGVLSSKKPIMRQGFQSFGVRQR
ncbi:MAG: CoA-binding protein [Aquamicrobium sp.]|jgi:predicted CoA-binding protein|uniref:CoA-binding protein n=1 Tax=Mesorhizobium sp. Pch-S TaxID=2082387 RepID=UPI001013B1E9|nr:CoA-binding protein [Mesorhizobium sp. Pch-S]MBR2686999.1 CoA-binding protein [Aquamicrobium sp.]QAZ41605.1 CoA-binding protein [Mesorhizobium sp. Pch-S]